MIRLGRLKRERFPRKSRCGTFYPLVWAKGRRACLGNQQTMTGFSLKDSECTRGPLLTKAIKPVEIILGKMSWKDSKPVFVLRIFVKPKKKVVYLVSNLCKQSTFHREFIWCLFFSKDVHFRLKLKSFQIKH